MPESRYSRFYLKIHLIMYPQTSVTHLESNPIVPSGSGERFGGGMALWDFHSPLGIYWRSGAFRLLPSVRVIRLYGTGDQAASGRFIPISTPSLPVFVFMAMRYNIQYVHLLMFAGKVLNICASLYSKPASCSPYNLKPARRRVPLIGLVPCCRHGHGRTFFPFV